MYITTQHSVVSAPISIFGALITPPPQFQSIQLPKTHLILLICLLNQIELIITTLVSKTETTNHSYLTSKANFSLPNRD